MRKFALLAFVTMLSFGFTGCMNPGNRWNANSGNRWNLPDPAQATIVDVWSDYETRGDKSVEFYVVVFEYDERFAKIRVEKDTFEAVHEGDTAEIELMSFSLTQDDQYLLKTEYCWRIGGREYEVIFRSDAEKRPVRPKIDHSKT